jgi:membrane protein DedA with SNARE-associated domain
MPIDTYIRITLFAVTVYVPIIFVFAYSFGPEIDAALVSVQRFSNAAWIILLVTILVWSTIRFRIMRQSLAEQNQELL